MKDQILEFLFKYPIAWVAVILLAPVAIRYRYLKFKRASSHSKDAKSKALLFVGGIGAALILWALLQYT